MCCNLKKNLSFVASMTVMGLLTAGQAHAGNIITFDDASQKCGGAVMCSYDGTTGYLNNGMGQAFNLSTIRQWFQIDVAGKGMLSSQLAEPDKDAGSFLVVNDTGAPITSFSLKVNDDFTTKTASVHQCSGAQKGNICDNFTAHGGNGTTFNTGLSGADWDRCTQGTTVGQTCTGNSGGVAADFSPGSVAYSWTAQPGKSIAAGATFRISFSGWNNDGWAMPPRAYIPNENQDGTVSVIDTGSNQVIATIPVGLFPYGVSVSPDGSTVYIANIDGNSVSVIDATSNSVTATIPLGTNPAGMTVSPDGSKVYVSNGGSNTVSVIDTAAKSVIATIDLKRSPYDLAVTPDGSHVYVVDADSNGSEVDVIDTASNSVSATIPLGSQLVAVAVSPDGSEVYVNDLDDGMVSVIETATNQVVATFFAGTGPMAFSPDGSRVYLSYEFGNSVPVIDTVKRTVIATIPVGNRPTGVSVTSDGAHAYVVNSDSNTVSVIDTATNMVTATVPVGNSPAALGNFIQP